MKTGSYASLTHTMSLGGSCFRSPSPVPTAELLPFLRLGRHDYAFLVQVSVGSFSAVV
jgi:hypothetical protein